MTDIFGCIEAYYNTIRAHSTLAYNSPAQFEQKIAAWALILGVHFFGGTPLILIYRKNGTRPERK